MAVKLPASDKLNKYDYEQDPDFTRLYYWQVENLGFVSAKLDEQKTDETKQKVIALAGKI